MKPRDLTKYIKSQQGDKVPQKTTSVNLELRHILFLKSKNLNLSGLIRDFIEELMKQDKAS